jgi:hypothetical protein
MLQALFKNKLKDSFSDPYFRPSEDSLTSSIIGLMQFLPDYLFWYLFKQSCGNNSDLPTDIGKINGFYFWDRWSAKGTYNSNYVEPDVWIDTEKYYIIIEAKKTDYFGQHIDQWENELRALKNEVEYLDKEIIFIALGGNDSLKNCSTEVDSNSYKIYTASWFFLLHSITLYISQKEDIDNYTERLLNNIVAAFSKHGFLDIDWLSSMKCRKINRDMKSVSFLMEFDNHDFFSGMYNPQNSFNKNSFGIWKK